MCERPSYEEMEKRIKDLEQEQRLAIEAARESEERYQAIFERSFDVIYILDFEGRFLDASHAGVDLLGYSREELKDITLTMLLTDKQIHQAFNTIEELKETGTQKQTEEYMVRCKDGSFIWLETLTSVIYRSGEPYAIQGIARNITEWKDAQEHLRKSSERYRTIFENTGNASICIGQDTTILLANSNFEKLSGYSKEEMEGKMSWTVFIADVDLERMKRYHAQRRENPESAPGFYEFRYKSRSGELRDIFLTIAMIPGTNESVASCMDITDRKRAEEALRLSEERYRAIFENTGNATIIIGEDKTIRLANSNFERLSGFSRHEIEGKMSWESFISENDLERLKEYHRIRRERPGSAPESYEFRFITRSGEARDILALVTLIPGTNESISNHIDITERKQAEEALRISEDKYRRILQSMEESYFEVDFAGNFTFFNSAACRMSGYSPEELLGMNYRIYAPPESAKLMFEAFNKVYMTGKPEFLVDYQVVHKDGSLHDNELSVWLMRDASGQPTGFNVLVRDVTVRKLAEKALRESEERYRTILENMEESYYEVDLKGYFTFFNRRSAQRLGYAYDELLGINYHQFMDAENAKKVFNAYHHCFITGETIANVDWKLHDRKGQEIFVEASVALRRDANGVPIGFSGVVRDITSRKKAEEALRVNEEKYRTILESMEEAYLESDLSGNFTFFNDSLCKVLGYTREELNNMNYRAISTSETSTRLYQVFNEVYNSGKPKTLIDHEIIRKDGSKRIIEMSVSLMQGISGEPVGFRGVGRDITERIQADLALLESEERYRSLFDRMMDGVYCSTPGGKFVNINMAMVNMFGYSSMEEMMNVDIANELYFRPEDRSSHFLGEKHDKKEVYRMRRKDGSEIWVEDHGHYVRDAQGEIVFHEGIMRDVTDSKRAEEAIKASEEQYRTIFENTGNASMLLGEDRTILLVNSNFEKLSGYSRDEIEGKMNWTEFVSPGDLERMKRYHEERREGIDSVPRSYEFRFLNRSGESRDIFLSIALIPGSRVSVASLMDITDRKNAEKALRESEERFRDLASLMPETVFETDEKGIFTFVNHSSFERFGFTSEEMKQGISVLDVIAPEEHERMVENYKRVMQGEKLGLNEYLARKKDGITFPALVHTTCVYHDGKPAGLRGFLIDMTEKKNLEQQLTRAQKMEAVGTLAGGIAHDFNNLLMGILGNISLILMHFDESHPFFDRLKSVEEYVQRGSDLTKQLLGFARGGKYEVKPTHLGEFIQKSAEMFGRTKKEIRIHHKIVQGLWAVDVDRGQMEQVMLNLFVNAWQAMPGGGDLYLSVDNIKLDKHEVSPYDIMPGRFVKVTVTDTGIGMDDSVKMRIFEPFFTTKERGRGTGLGLASVYGIVKNHGGFINVESEKDLGTSFMIYLPASDKDVPGEHKTNGEIIRGHETVLLIDDEEMILDIGSKMLEGLGYKVLAAPGGRQGLKIYDQAKDEIALVILDMIMPDFGGKETFETLRRVNPNVKVLLSSGYSLDGQAKDIMKSGCKGFIQKPFSMAEFSKRIRDILDQQ